MRLLVAALSAACLTLTLGAPAQASAPVTIKKIGTKTAPYKKTVTVKPSYRKTGRTEITKATLTVKKGRKTVARNKPSVRLKAGKYSLSQTVRYRTYANRSVKIRIVAKGSNVRGSAYRSIPVNAPFVNDCTLTAVATTSESTGTYVAGCTVHRRDDTERLIGRITARGTWATDLVNGDTTFVDQSGNAIATEWSSPSTGLLIFPAGLIRADRDLFLTSTKRAYSKVRSVTKRQSLTVRQGAKPRTCATYADFKRVNFDFAEPEEYGDPRWLVADKLHGDGKRTSYSDYGDMIIEFREYKACKKDAWISVGFSDGYAYAKSYWD